MSKHMDVTVASSSYQYLLLIIIDTNELAITELRNYVLRHYSAVTKNYGEFVGIGTPLITATNLSHRWRPEEVVFLFTFDRADYAETFLHIARFHVQFRVTLDILLIPLLNVLRSSYTFPYFELGLFDVKYPQQFRDYVQKLSVMIDNHSGTMIASTNKVKSWAGSRRPNYVTTSQWTNDEQYRLYQQEDSNLQNEEQYACTTRVLFKITPFNNK
ncbi:hypothetical protein D915_003582 [Fasciola hepatica]|uniref:Uncharacterized protein n=1 Tax=Fasciola hepatica TaxID=6192 RepID=A0A4E0RDM1_FASHE|nr:hypothetical protein D915_003582 [Fasciola hepatica]